MSAEKSNIEDGEGALSPPLHLHATNLIAGYGKKQVLNGVTLNIKRSEIVALIGHNGAGKSTLLKALFGIIPLWGGEVYLDGRQKIKLTPREMLEYRVAYIPQGNRVFKDLTVDENLRICSNRVSSRQSSNGRFERVFNLFPALRTRLKQFAGDLSGGEKQMLALANILLLEPELLLIDEPSLGLAPPLVSVALDRIRRMSNEYGLSVLIVEQKVRQVLGISDRVYVLRNGQVTFS